MNQKISEEFYEYLRNQNPIIHSLYGVLICSVVLLFRSEILSIEFFDRFQNYSTVIIKINYIFSVFCLIIIVSLLAKCLYSYHVRNISNENLTKIKTVHLTFAKETNIKMQLNDMFVLMVYKTQYIFFVVMIINILFFKIEIALNSYRIVWIIIFIGNMIYIVQIGINIWYLLLNSLHEYIFGAINRGNDYTHDTILFKYLVNDKNPYGIFTDIVKTENNKSVYIESISIDHYFKTSKTKKKYFQLTIIFVEEGQEKNESWEFSADRQSFFIKIKSENLSELIDYYKLLNLD